VPPRRAWNRRAKIGGWKWTGEFVGVNCFDKFCSLLTYCTQQCYHTVLIWLMLHNNSQKVSLVMFVLPLPPPAHLRQFLAHLCMCLWVCLREKEHMSVCCTLWNITDICVTIRKLAKTGDLERAACNDFVCYCVLDACCPLTVLATAHPFPMMISCVCVCSCPFVSACL